MALEKSDGESWGALITFTHVGQEMTVDVGWVAHLGELYLWCRRHHLFIPAHWEPTVVEVHVGGDWRMGPGVGVGDLISAQAVVCPDGALDVVPPDGGTRKMDTHLTDIRAYAENTERDVYKAMGGGGISGLGVIGK